MKPNFNMYFEKVGDYPDRIMSLSFYFEFLLRAVNKASEVFINFPYKTGDDASDEEVKYLIK